MKTTRHRSKLTLRQDVNKKWTRDDAKWEKNSAQWVYTVVSTVNFIGINLGRTLLPSEVQALIDNGSVVTIK